MKTKKLFCVILLPLVCFFLSCKEFPADGLYTARTQDGVDLKLKRYRPSTDVPFNDGQPVLLFTGFAENLNEYIPHTSNEAKERYKDMSLDNPIQIWAVNDEFIREDPMLYFSLAHYLWNKGYDPWLANYRGAGRGKFKSGWKDSYVTLDIYSAFDVSASVDLVISETGNAPVIGGHSTGGLVCYSYLQGIYFDPEELEEGSKNGYIPHVKSDPDLAAERNEKVKGFLGIDPAGIIPLPDMINTTAFWQMMGLRLYIDLDTIVENFVNPFIMDTQGDKFLTNMDKTLQLIFKMDDEIGQYIPIFEMLCAWNTQNTHSYIEDYFWRNCFSGTFVRAASQYYENAMNNTMREHWKNGEENKKRLKGPKPDPGNDSYYYYNENMHRMHVPAISVLSEPDSLVKAAQIIEDVMQAKAPHELDEWHIIPNTGHNDIVFGYTAPEMTFPLIGDWLDRVCGGDLD